MSDHAVGMLAGLMLTPAATPSLVWAAIAADLPLTLVSFQLIIMAVTSNILLCNLIRRAADTPWSTDTRTD